MKILSDIRKFAYRIIPERAFKPVIGVFVLHFCAYYVPKIVNSGRVHHTLETVVDSYIPFLPFFVIFYVLAFIQWCVYYVILAREEKSVMYRYLAAGAVSKIISMIMFIVVPTVIVRPQPADTGVFNFCCRAVYAFDVPTNLFPSMHVLESWLCMRLALEEHYLGRVPEVSRSIVRGYSGEMILCVNKKQWDESAGDFTAVSRKNLGSVFEKIFSRRKWTKAGSFARTVDSVAETAENHGQFFIRVHTARTCILSILVFFSTVFIKQHYFVDVVSAVVVAEISLFAGKKISSGFNK